MKHALLTLFIAITSFGSIANAFSTRINQPKYNGYALDWCKVFENACGQPAADLYCQKRGYGPSTGFQIRGHVNVQTMTVGQNSICNPGSHNCDSFQYIDCQEKQMTFNTPTYNGYRLDWCSQFENGCGANAAQKWCQKKGYAQAVNYQKQGSLNVQTMTVGSNAICNPQYHVCDSFTFITCRK